MTDDRRQWRLSIEQARDLIAEKGEVQLGLSAADVRRLVRDLSDAAQVIEEEPEFDGGFF